MAIVALTSTNGVTVSADAKVLKAGDYALFREAEAVLAEARERAAELIREAEERCEAIHGEAYTTGMMEGKEEISAQMLEMVAVSADQLAQTESSMVEIVMRSLRTILGEFDDTELASRVVGHALRMVRDEKRIILRVSTHDVDGVRKNIEDIAARYPIAGRIDVVGDASLTRGGCVIETSIGVIDASLDKQLAMIEETFRRQVEERGANEFS